MCVSSYSTDLVEMGGLRTEQTSKRLDSNEAVGIPPSETESPSASSIRRRKATSSK